MDHVQLQAVWDLILDKIREQLNETVCKQWLAPLIPKKYENGTLTLVAANNFTKQYIDKMYINFLSQAATDVIGEGSVTVVLDIAPQQPIEPPQVEIPEEKKFEQGKLNMSESQQEQHGETYPGAVGATDLIAPGDASSLNPKYVFDTFVVGNSNKFAEAAAVAIANEPGKIYNPFFMYGGVGLGKTHLMHAIGHKVLEKFPEKRVLYITSEKFTNELINSIRDGNPENFRQKYRNVDVLMVDDIQFLSKKEHTQEEFFHTFNTLHNDGKAIILSSDRPPKELKTLEDRLRSRFEWGLTADIQAPDLETRIAILKKKALLENIDVSNDVLVYIASRIDTNIRELEGALTRVSAYASLNNQPISTELVATSFKDLFPTTKTKEITIEVIQEIVSQYYKVSLEDLLGKKRTRTLAFPRQIAMYLCRELTDTSLPQIGELFGGRDHTTVIHAYEKISSERKESSKLDETINKLIQQIERM